MTDIVVVINALDFWVPKRDLSDTEVVYITTSGRLYDQWFPTGHGMLGTIGSKCKETVHSLYINFDELPFVHICEDLKLRSQVYGGVVKYLYLYSALGQVDRGRNQRMEWFIDELEKAHVITKGEINTKAALFEDA